MANNGGGGGGGGGAAARAGPVYPAGMDDFILGSEPGGMDFIRAFRTEDSEGERDGSGTGWFRRSTLLHKSVNKQLQQFKQRGVLNGAFGPRDVGNLFQALERTVTDALRLSARDVFPSLPSSLQQSFFACLSSNVFNQERPTRVSRQNSPDYSTPAAFNTYIDLYNKAQDKLVSPICRFVFYTLVDSSLQTALAQALQTALHRMDPIGSLSSYQTMVNILHSGPFTVMAPVRAILAQSGVEAQLGDRRSPAGATRLLFSAMKTEATTLLRYMTVPNGPFPTTPEALTEARFSYRDINVMLNRLVLGLNLERNLPVTSLRELKRKGLVFQTQPNGQDFVFLDLPTEEDDPHGVVKAQDRHVWRAHTESTRPHGARPHRNGQRNTNSRAPKRAQPAEGNNGKKHGRRRAQVAAEAPAPPTTAAAEADVLALESARPTFQCWCCGDPGHSRQDCPRRKEARKCPKCEWTHIGTTCISPKRRPKPPKSSGATKKKRGGGGRAGHGGSG